MPLHGGSRPEVEAHRLDPEAPLTESKEETPAQEPEPTKKVDDENDVEAHTG